MWVYHRPLWIFMKLVDVEILIVSDSEDYQEQPHGISQDEVWKIVDYLHSISFTL